MVKCTIIHFLFWKYSEFMWTQKAQDNISRWNLLSICNSYVLPKIGSTTPFFVSGWNTFTSSRDVRLTWVLQFYVMHPEKTNWKYVEMSFSISECFCKLFIKHKCKHKHVSLHNFSDKVFLDNVCKLNTPSAVYEAWNCLPQLLDVFLLLDIQLRHNLCA